MKREEKLGKKYYDVVIIGAGPAGLAAAITLERKGIHCLVLEQRAVLRGKICGDAVTVKGLRLLAELGIFPDELKGNKAFYKTIWRNGCCQTESFREIFGDPFEMGVPRDVLDPCLLRKAEEAGADIHMNERCRIMQGDQGGDSDFRLLVNETYHARLVILAVGAAGCEDLAMESPQLTDLPFGISARVYDVQGYRADTFYYWYREEIGHGYAWLFPVGDHLWNIGVWSSNRKRQLPALYRELEKKVAGGSVTRYDRKPGGAWIGASMQGKTLVKSTLCKGTADACILWIGDCACAADYSSGEGISYALEEGILAGNKAAARLHPEDPQPDGEKFFIKRTFLTGEREAFIRKVMARDDPRFMRILSMVPCGGGSGMDEITAEWIDGVTLTTAGEKNPNYFHSAGEMVRGMHDDYRTGRKVSLTEDQIRHFFGFIRSHYPNRKAVQCLLQYALDSLTVLNNRPETLIHGDLHGDNILVDVNEHMRLVDFDDMRTGDPYRDLVFTVAIHREEDWEPSAALFLDGYFKGGIPADFWRIVNCYAIVKMADIYEHDERVLRVCRWQEFESFIRERDGMRRDVPERMMQYIRESDS